MADEEDLLEDRPPRVRNSNENSVESRNDAVSQSFDLMRNYFDQQFSSLKRDLRDEVHSSSIDTFKRFKDDSSSYSFKFKGNQRQYLFNSDIVQELDILSDLIKHGERRQSLLDNLSEIRKKLSRRNKLIKIADKSPAGWETVNEYVSDELASDSEDDKKLRRAEKRAMAKKKPRPSKKPSATVSSATASSFMDSSPYQHAFPGFTSAPNSFRQFRRNPSFIQCFACGGFGHTRPECPTKFQTPGSTPSIRGFSGIPWQKGGEQPVQLVKQHSRQSAEDK